MYHWMKRILRTAKNAVFDPVKAVRPRMMIMSCLTIGRVSLGIALCLGAILVALSTPASAQGRDEPPNAWPSTNDRSHLRSPKRKAVEVAATYFKGTDGDMSAAANWTNSVPDDTHTPAIFDGDYTNYGVWLNMDLSANSFTLETMPNFYGDIGGPGNPLIWDGISGRQATIRHRGKAYLKTPVTDSSEYVIRAPHAKAVDIQAKFARLVVSHTPNVTLAPTCTFAGRLIITGETAHVTLAKAAAAEIGPTHLVVNGGEFVNQRVSANGDEFIINRGVLRQQGKLNSGTYLHVTGGTVLYEPDVGDIGAGVIFNGIAGHLDLSAVGDTLSWGVIILLNGFTIDGEVHGGLAPDIDMRQSWP